jgi:alcohol dehydrogenase class IV
MSQRFHNPVAIHYGNGCLQELPQLLGAGKVVLVTFPEARVLGLVARMEQLLGDRLSYVIDDIQPNPDVAALRGMYDKFWQQGQACDTLVALGGGSVIDTAKALLVGTASGSFAELLALLAEGKPFTLGS